MAFISPNICFELYYYVTVLCTSISNVYHEILYFHITGLLVFSFKTSSHSFVTVIKQGRVPILNIDTMPTKQDYSAIISEPPLWSKPDGSLAPRPELINTGL